MDIEEAKRIYMECDCQIYWVFRAYEGEVYEEFRKSVSDEMLREWGKEKCAEWLEEVKKTHKWWYIEALDDTAERSPEGLDIRLRALEFIEGKNDWENLAVAKVIIGHLWYLRMGIISCAYDLDDEEAARRLYDIAFDFISKADPEGKEKEKVRRYKEELEETFEKESIRWRESRKVLKEIEETGDCHAFKRLAEVLGRYRDDRSYDMIRGALDKLNAETDEDKFLVAETIIGDRDIEKVHEQDYFERSGAVYISVDSTRQIEMVNQAIHYLNGIRSTAKTWKRVDDDLKKLKEIVEVFEIGKLRYNRIDRCLRMILRWVRG